MLFYPSTNKNVELGEIALNKHTVSSSFCSVNGGIMSYEDWSLMSLLSGQCFAGTHRSGVQ